LSGGFLKSVTTPGHFSLGEPGQKTGKPHNVRDKRKEIPMKGSSLNLVLFSGLLTIGCAVGAAEMPTSGITMTPEQMTWKDNPRVPGLGVAHIISKGTDAGPYVYRVRFPKGRRVQSHSHPDDRTYTVLKGNWYIGWGEDFDESKLIKLGPGSFYTEPAGVPHFVSTPDGEAVVQVTGTGPTTINYVNPAHDTRKK
jgi:quercetin dioxygenase-like cupin family protein